MKLIRSTLDLETHVQIMGVLNVTPDSFSDGGQHCDPERAVDRALQMVAEGAGIVDIGGESTRPGSEPVSPAEELARVRPVLDSLARRLAIPISIDTTKTEVARYALNAGAEMINDVNGLRSNPELADIAAQTGAALVLMHSRGTPKTMQQLPPVENILEEVTWRLAESIEIAIARGVSREKLIIDPGIGFGKTARQSLELVNHLDQLREHFGLPVLVGPSRKSFIGRTLDSSLGTESLRDEVRERVFGTAASVSIAIERGARILRVHDVAEMVAVARVTESILDT